MKNNLVKASLRPVMLALLLAPVLFFSAAAQEENTLERIDDLVARMDRSSAAEIWGLTAEIAELVGTEGAAFEKIAQGLSSGNPLVRLGCAKVLIEKDGAEDALPILVELAAGADGADVRLKAIQLIGILDYIDDPYLSDVEQALVAILDAENDPFFRIEAAKALGTISSRYALRASRELRAALDSDNPDIRVAGALALAESGEVDLAKNILQEVRNDPTPEGRLARTYLLNWDLQRYYLNTVTEKSMGLESAGASLYGMELIRELIDKIREHHILGDQFQSKEGLDKLLTAAAKGMVSYIDDHSTYFSQEENERWRMDLIRSYAGIGAYVDTIDGVFQITRPIYSGPAYKAGLRSGDQVWKVDGWETFNQENDEIIRRLKGLPDTEVTVTIFRPGWREERNFTIPREVISIPTISTEMLPGGIAYIEIKQFSDGAARDLAEQLKDLQQDENVKGIVFDVRNNTGGYLQEAVAISSFFLPPEKLVVYTQGRDRAERNDYKSKRYQAHWDGPLVVLANRRSASASEIVAGALKHYERGVIIGEKTYGKGSVQTPKALNSLPPEDFTDVNRNGIYDPGEKFDDLNHNGVWDVGPMVKITTAMYYLPSGKSIHTLRNLDGTIAHEGGIEPDVKVKYEGVEPWKEEELADLLEKDAFKNYVENAYLEHKDLFVQLADDDGFDWSRYPGFDEFYEGLQTHLDKNEIRRWLRADIRRKVADERGRAFPGFHFYGDFQEDNQLQAAILEVLKKAGIAAGDIAEYAAFAGKTFGEKESEAALSESSKTGDPAGNPAGNSEGEADLLDGQIQR